MLTESQVSKLQKASRLAELLAKDSHIPFHKHPEVVAGAHSPIALCCMTSLPPPGTLTDHIPGAPLSVQQAIIQ
eukprot:COSAG02_NODE_7070_length_3200_cov_2.047082_3_plen_74_part_00